MLDRVVGVGLTPPGRGSPWLSESRPSSANSRTPPSPSPLMRSIAGRPLLSRASLSRSVSHSDLPGLSSLPVPLLEPPPGLPLPPGPRRSRLRLCLSPATGATGRPAPPPSRGLQSRSSLLPPPRPYAWPPLLWSWGARHCPDDRIVPFARCTPHRQQGIRALIPRPCAEPPLLWSWGARHCPDDGIVPFARCTPHRRQGHLRAFSSPPATRSGCFGDWCDWNFKYMLYDQEALV